MTDALTEMAVKLTPKQRAFANEIAAGTNPSQAYRKCFNCVTASQTTVGAKASHLKSHPKVGPYIAALIAQQEKKRLLTRERKREHLALFVEDKTARTADRIKAIEVDNVMTGDNAPQQVQVFGLSDLLALVRKKS